MGMLVARAGRMRRLAPGRPVDAGAYTLAYFKFVAAGAPQVVYEGAR